MSDENNYENPNENDVIDVSGEVYDVAESKPYSKRAILWVIGSATSMVVAVIMIVVTASMFYNNGQLEKRIQYMESEQEALNDEVDTWKYKASSAAALATNYKEENEEISAKLKTLQDQQTQIDDLTKQLADTKAQYDALKAENDTTKTQLTQEQQTASSSRNSGVTSTDTTEQNVGQMVWLSATGSKYHNKPDCGNMNPNTARQISISDAGGYSACNKCF